MKLRVYLMTSAASLLAVSCASVGDFCDVAKPLEYNSNATADYISDNDTTLSERVATHNLYGEAACGWKFDG